MKIFILGIVLFLGLFFCNCSEEEEVFDSSKYLDLNSSIENPLNFDKEIVLEAQKRLAKFVRIEQNQFVLKITSGKDVNMSEELFQNFQNTIALANAKAKEKGYIILGDRVRKNQVSIPKVKSLAENGGQEYVSSTGVDYTWYGMRIDISSQDVKDVLLGITSLELILENCKTGNPQVDAIIKSSQVLAAGGAFLTSYYDNGNGFSIICPLYVPAYAASY